MELFSINGKFFHFMYKLADLMILSALWLLCSLPVFTLFAASTSLYYCVVKVIREEGSSPTKTFFRAFRENFKKSTCAAALLLLASIFVSLIGSGIYFLAGGSVLTNVYTVYLVLGGLVAAWLHYVLSYLARFDAPLKTVLKNSLVICLVNLPLSISMLVLFVVVWGGYALLLPRSVMFILLLPGAYCWLSSLILERIYQKYLPNDG